ncbi:MAG: hypothetical protein AAF984_00975 [Verrucomicrobiota bacterium]
MKILQFSVISALLSVSSSLSCYSQDQASSILQKETIRRQELVLRANQTLAEAEKLLLASKETEASKLIEGVLKSVPDAGEGKAVASKARRLLSAIQLQDAYDMMESKEWYAAKRSVDKALEIDPTNPEALRLNDKLVAQLGLDQQGRPANPALDEQFYKNFNTVKDLLAKAKDFYDTGQLDEAEKIYQRILAIDPYNKVASEKLKLIAKNIDFTKEIHRKNNQKERINQVKMAWSERFEVDVLDELVTEQNTTTSLTQNTRFDINQKLNGIIIPELNFQGASIEDAVAFLNKQTRILDKEGEGISFLLKKGESSVSAPITLRLKNTPVIEALRYITTLAGMKSRVEQFAVFIVPLTERVDVLVTRDFVVRPSFFETASELGEGDDSSSSSRRRRTSISANTTVALSDADRVKEVLEAKGVAFPEGAAAIYNKSKGVLNVKNTQDQIDLIEELVIDEQGDNLLVKVDAKFIEINQTDLEELTSNLSFSGGNYSGVYSGTTFGTAQVSSNMLGSANFNANSIDSQINARSATDTVGNNAENVPTNRLAIYGEVGGNNFEWLVDSLDQKGSVDLMTAPSVVVNDGAQGEVAIVREFIYPTEFETPQIQRSGTLAEPFDSTGDGNEDSARVFSLPSTVIPSWPIAFETRELGVKMTVYPRVSPDRKRVLLDIKPDVVEFDGFINYGARISDVNVIVAANEYSGALANENIVNQPVFSVRAVEEARLVIEDGQTMVLGGLINENIDIVEEKVPILGDLPLIGRAFRSEAERSVKMNLMILITVNILRPDGQPYNFASQQAAPSTAGL